MPFENFTMTRLEALLRSFPLSPGGRRFVDAALTAPSRNAQGTTRNVVSDIPCPKMWGNAQSESWSAENAFVLKHIFDEEVIGYATQVPPLELKYRGRNGHMVRTPYTGDCLTLHASRGILLEEWKPASDRGQLEEKYPGKYQRLDSGDYTSEPIDAIVASWGIKFIVRFSDDISSIGHRNRRFLHNYLGPRASAAYAPSLPPILDMLKDTPCRTYADLVDSGADRDTLNWAVATGNLHADLDTAPISSAPSDVLIFRHRETMRAWVASLRPDGTRPSTVGAPAARELRPGDSFMFDGKRLTVSMVGATAVHAIDHNREYVSIEHHVLAAARLAGKAVLPSTDNQAESRSRFWIVSPATLAKALRRVEILEKIEFNQLVPIGDQYSPSTLRRWRRAVKEGESSGLSPVESLLDFADERGFRGPHVDSQFSVQLNGWIYEALKDDKAKSTNAIYYDIRATAEAAGYTMVAKSSFYERVSKVRCVETIRSSQGHKVARQLEPVHWMLSQETPIHCERALELVHFDSTLLDCELRSSISGEILGRPWLSIAVCAYTRRVVGMYLSFQPPSYVSTMMLLADIIKRFGRLPDAIIHDWGSEFKAKDWKYALTILYIIRHVRPKSAPRFGAILERMFGVVTRELIDNIAGNTKLRKNVRQITPQSDPSTHSGLWMADLYCGLEEYFFGIYDNRKHPATLREPRALFEASFISHGARLHRIRRYEDTLPILMPTAKGRPRVIDPARGINVNYRYYGHPLMATLAMSGTSALVKPIPFDPGTVLAFVKGNWVICQAGIHSDLARAPEIVRRCLFEEWRVEQRLVRASNEDSRMVIKHLQDRLNQKAIDNKEYWREREARDALTTGTFPLGAAEAESDAVSTLDRMMQQAVASALAQGTRGELV